MRKTKIVCTLGPACENEEILKNMMKAGMNVVRMNFSHGDHVEHGKRVEQVKKLRKELNLPVALLLDTKGPEIRTGKYETGKIEIVKGQTFTLTSKDIMGNSEIVSISYKNLVKDVKKGDRILICDGLIEFIVMDTTETDIICEAQNSGALGNTKSINVPDVYTNMQYMSEKDKADIIFAAENDFDYIAASFVREPKDVLEIREILAHNGGSDIKIISKIENKDGVKNIDGIVEVSDGVMVARGDMGVEIPFEDLPIVQKQIIKACNKAGKPVITATQMLDSMINNPRPTRAEITDVANAIFDGTSAIMLSGETAAGKYPVETIITMAKIAEKAESAIDYKGILIKNSNYKNDVTEAISYSTCSIAETIEAKAIISLTVSGKTSRNIAKFRPFVPVVAGTYSEKTYRQLSLVWGIYPILVQDKDNADELFDEASKKASDLGIVEKEDRVVLTAGTPLGKVGTTNTLKVHVIE